MPTDIIAPMMIYVRTMPLIDFFDYRCYRIWYVDYFCEKELGLLSIKIGKSQLDKFQDDERVTEMSDKDVIC